MFEISVAFQIFHRRNLRCFDTAHLILLGHEQGEISRSLYHQDAKECHKLN